MATIPQRELRNNCSGVLRRVEAGESIKITVDGRSVARLTGIVGRRRFVSAADFLRLFLTPLRPDWESVKREVSDGIDHAVHDRYERRA